MLGRVFPKIVLIEERIKDKTKKKQNTKSENRSARQRVFPKIELTEERPCAVSFLVKGKRGVT